MEKGSVRYRENVDRAMVNYCVCDGMAAVSGYSYVQSSDDRSRLRCHQVQMLLCVVSRISPSEAELGGDSIASQGTGVLAEDLSRDWVLA